MWPASFGFAWVHSGGHRCCRAYSGSRVFTRARVVFSEYTLVRKGSFWRAKGLPCLFGISWVYSGAPRCRRVNFGSLAFTWTRKVAVVIYQFRVGSLGLACVARFMGFHLGLLWRELVRSCSCWFTLTRMWSTDLLGFT